LGGGVPGLIDDADVFNDKLRGWQDYFNRHRSHGGLGGQTPTKASSRRPPGSKRSPSVAQAGEAVGEVAGFIVLSSYRR
jgi:hypothetical protein